MNITMIGRAIYRNAPVIISAGILVVTLLGCPNPNWGITFKIGEKWKRDYKISLLDGDFTAKISAYEGATSDIHGNELTLHFKYVSKLKATDFCTVPDSLEVYCQGKKLPPQYGNDNLNGHETAVPTCLQGLQERFVFKWEIDPALFKVTEQGSMAPLQLHIKVSGMFRYRGESLMTESLMARLWIP